MKNTKMWVNGRIVEGKDAVTPILTNALHYGNAVFEGIRCYATDKGPAIFRLREHVRRLLRSSHILSMKHGFGEEQIQRAVKETIRANKLKECYIRPLLYADEGGFDLIIDHAKISLAIAVWPWKLYLGEDALKRGVRAMVSSYTRHHVNIAMTKAKISGNYVNSTLARTEAFRNGYDEAIMLDTRGYVAECTGENIFMVKDGTIFTPPLAGILDGITRDSIMQLAAALGYTVQEREISRDELYIADEVFVTGTAAEITGLREIDTRAIGNGSLGEMTKKLQAAFTKVVSGKDKHFLHWLDSL